MAAAVEQFEMSEDGVVVFAATVTYDDLTFAVTRVEWENPGPHDWRLAINTPTMGDLVSTIRAGQNGRRNNVPAGYFIDGPLGAGYQLWTV